MQEALTIKNVDFSFDAENMALKDIYISGPKGEFLTILGASGSEKSILLRIVSGILPSSQQRHFEGDVYIDTLVQKEYLDTGKLSFMFQEPSGDANDIIFRVEKPNEQNTLSEQRLVCLDLLKAFESSDEKLASKSLTYIEDNKIEQTFEFYDSTIKKMKLSGFNDSEIYQRLITLLKKTR